LKESFVSKVEDRLTDITKDRGTMKGRHDQTAKAKQFLQQQYYSAENPEKLQASRAPDGLGKSSGSDASRDRLLPADVGLSVQSKAQAGSAFNKVSQEEYDKDSKTTSEAVEMSAKARGKQRVDE
jgi:hypothetical protein